jgi:leucyl-tRNA synthetase
VLANEQVKNGRCERCGCEVEARKLDQWFFRITAYADSLIDEMKELDWPERVLAMQRNWIGRSEGAEILFRVDELDIDIPVFTTRPDTLYGSTFFVLAPEHPLVDRLAEQSPNGDEIRAYVRKAGARPAAERAAGTKTGVFTGFFATNPVNDARIPIWVADYVLMDYGTGAIMAVPAHDERDAAFAERFGIPIVEVIDEDGVLVNSEQFDGLPAEAAKAIVDWLGGVAWLACGELPPRATGASPPRTGLSDSDRSSRTVGSFRGEELP